MKKNTSFDSYSIIDTPFIINEDEEKLPDDRKYDLVLFTNRPELWTKLKTE